MMERGYRQWGLRRSAAVLAGVALALGGCSVEAQDPTDGLPDRVEANVTNPHMQTYNDILSEQLVTRGVSEQAMGQLCFSSIKYPVGDGLELQPGVVKFKLTTRKSIWNPPCAQYEVMSAGGVVDTELG